MATVELRRSVQVETVKTKGNEGMWSEGGPREFDRSAEKEIFHDLPRNGMTEGTSISRARVHPYTYKKYNWRIVNETGKFEKLTCVNSYFYFCGTACLGGEKNHRV
jgi:hypothetical protein